MRGAQEGGIPVVVEGEFFLAWPKNSWRWGENQLGYLRVISERPSLPPCSKPERRNRGVPPPEEATGATRVMRSSKAPAMREDFPLRETPVMAILVLSMAGSVTR